MRRVIHLDKGEIDDLVQELNEFADSFPTRCQMAVQELCDEGIKVATANAGEYKGMILFTKEIDLTESGCSALMIATDLEKPVRSWRYQGGEKSVEISPILMAEFGSGWAADPEPQIYGMGQGSFPGQTHAFDTQGWFWKDLDGETHHSYGEAPTYPMYKASVEMVSKIQEVFEKYF